VTTERKYQLALGALGLFILLIIYKLWKDGALFDLSIQLGLPDWLKDFFGNTTKQDEFDRQLADQARSVGIHEEAQALEDAIEDDHSKTKEEWGEIATGAVAGAIIIGFIAYLIAGPAGIAFGIAAGIGLGGLVSLAYVELKEKANRDAARGDILAAMLALPGYMGPAGEKPKD